MRCTPRRCRPSSFLAAVATHDVSSPALSSGGKTVSYGELAESVCHVMGSLLAMRGANAERQQRKGVAAHSRTEPLRQSASACRATLNNSRLHPGRVAFLTPPSRVYASTLLAVWVAGLIGVPLSPLYPPQALVSTVTDCGAEIVVTAEPHGEDDVSGLRTSREDSFSHLHLPATVVDRDTCAKSSDGVLETAKRAQDQLRRVASEVPLDRPAMLLYTSGTTGSPKGVVWTHGMVDYQVATLAKAWRWAKEDRILNVLPLHHVHGIVNVLLTCLYAGAHCEMMNEFDAKAVWAAFGRSSTEAPNVFMGVPTVYNRLINHFESATKEDQMTMRLSASAMRLYVCGSAALSLSALEAWHRISGHLILERYGMTETGMLLSNPYDERIPASLGVPLPGVEVKVSPDADEKNSYGTSASQNEGELLVRGPGIFSEYWNRADATTNAFDGEKWFRTGDIVRIEANSQRCYMLGRASTDIIKSGGYKLSSLEIEDKLADNPLVAMSAVFGVEDAALGQRLACVIVPKHPRSALTATDLTEWLSDRLPRYKIPRDIHIVDEGDFPRNALGKVQKNILVRQYEAGETA